MAEAERPKQPDRSEPINLETLGVSKDLKGLITSVALLINKENLSEKEKKQLDFLYKLMSETLLKHIRFGTARTKENRALYDLMNALGQAKNAKQGISHTQEGFIDGQQRDFRPSPQAPQEGLEPELAPSRKRVQKVPEPPSEKPRFFANKIKKLILAALVGTPLAYAAGLCIAEVTVANAQAKKAIAIVTNDPDLNGKPIGYLYGPLTNRPEELAGIDKAIPAEVSNLPELFYRGLITLEDKGHDGGFSDYTGLNVRAPYTILMRQGGGSSLADQACGAMREGQDEAYLFDWAEGTPLQKPAYYGYKIEDKLVETLCGMGLSWIHTPKEIVADYATFSYLAPGAYGAEVFVRKYWDLEGLDDPRLTRGQQLLLAAFINHPWSSSDKNWEANKKRAFYALDQLVEQGFVKEKDKEKIKQEIEAAKPDSFKEVKKEGMSIAPKYGFNPAMNEVAKEMEGLIGTKDWRSEVRSITVTTDPNVQGATYLAAQALLEKLDDDQLRASVLVRNELGEIVALFTGDKNGLDQFGIQRLYAERSVGSLGKILTTAAVAQNWPNGTNIQNSAYYHSLGLSSHAVIDEAKKIGVGTSTIENLISCYGTQTGQGDSVRASALGEFDTSPMRFVSVADELRTGRSAEQTHIVSAYQKADGTNVTVQTKSSASADCAEAIFAGGRTQKFLTAPLEPYGTLSDLKGQVDFGKTGTVGHEDSESNVAVWSLTSTQREDHFYTVMVGLGRDDGSVSPSLATSGEITPELTEAVLSELKERAPSLNATKQKKNGK